MKAKCLTSFFSQNQSGTVGQILEINDKQVMDELVSAGYVEEVESTNSASSKGETQKNNDAKRMTAKTKKAVDNHENE